MKLLTLTRDIFTSLIIAAIILGLLFVLLIIVPGAIRSFCDKDYYAWPKITICQICEKDIWAWEGYERREWGLEVDNSEMPEDSPLRITGASMSAFFHKKCRGTPVVAPLKLEPVPSPKDH